MKKKKKKKNYKPCFLGCGHHSPRRHCRPGPGLDLGRLLMLPRLLLFCHARVVVLTEMVDGDGTEVFFSVYSMHRYGLEKGLMLS